MSYEQRELLFAILGILFVVGFWGAFFITQWYNSPKQREVREEKHKIKEFEAKNDYWGDF